MPENLFPYPGGKYYLASWVISHIPRHKCYVEPFSGAATVFFSKGPSDVDVINDRNSDIVHFFETLRDQGDELVGWLENVPYSRELHEKWVREYYDGIRSDDPVERAGRFFYLRYSQFSAKIDDVSGFRTSAVKCVQTHFLHSVSDLEEFRDRLREAVIENQDYKDIVERYDRDGTFFYFDPPYVQEGDYIYDCEFDHDEFVSVVDGLDGKWIASCTQVPDGLTDFRILERQEVQHMRKGNRMQKKTRTERLVMNFDPNEEPMFAGAAQTTLTDGGFDG